MVEIIGRFERAVIAVYSIFFRIILQLGLAQKVSPEPFNTGLWIVWTGRGDHWPKEEWGGFRFEKTECGYTK